MSSETDDAGADFDLTELQAVFRAEGQELVERLLAALDELPRAEAAARDELLTTARRTLHNIKGSAGSVGLPEIADASHAMEDIVRAPDFVARAQAGQLTELVDTLEEMLLVLQEKSAPASLTPRVASLRQSCAPTAPPAAAPNAAPSPSAPGPTPDAETGAPETAAPPPPRSGATIRVEVERLDNALATSTELITAGARLKTDSAALQLFLKDLVANAGAHDRDAEWLVPLLARARTIAQENQRRTNETQRLIADLSQAMKSIRMVPLHRLAGTWRAIVREAAVACGKRVQLAVETGDIEVDRDVLEAIQDPMLHLLRNAVDHGIEPPAEREARHKPEGRIVVTAAAKGPVVEVEVGDDGRGLDDERIRHRAVEHRLLDAEQAAALGPAALAELIFAPGFTTAERVSNVSGRGVGLDIVRSAVEALGGSVSVRSGAPTGGTTFTLSLPASRISTAGLFVRAGRTECALPLGAIERVVRVRGQKMIELGGQTLIRFAELGPVRIVALSSVLGQSPLPGSSAPGAYVVVLARGSRRLGLLADEILGEDVFVSTRLPWNIGSISALAGAIRRPDGSLALAIDVGRLFANLELIPASPAATSGGPPAHRVLVVDDALAIRSFEENLFRHAGYEVRLAADGEQAWEMLGREVFDLVVSDVDMPGLDGLELTRRIRTTPSLRDLPVVLVSSHGLPGDRAAGAAAGADDYLVKGTFQGAELLATVRRFLGGQAA